MVKAELFFDEVPVPEHAAPHSADLLELLGVAEDADQRFLPPVPRAELHLQLLREILVDPLEQIDVALRDLRSDVVLEDEVLRFHLVGVAPDAVLFQFRDLFLDPRPFLLLLGILLSAVGEEHVLDLARRNGDRAVVQVNLVHIARLLDFPLDVPAVVKGEDVGVQERALNKKEAREK